MERYLAQALVALVVGDRTAVANAVAAVVARAEAGGQLLMARRTYRILAATNDPPPISALLRLY